MEATSGILTGMSVSEGELVIRLCGDLDFAVTPRLMGAIEAVLDDAVSAYVLDCQDVTFIDSETLKALLLLRQRLHESSQFLTLRNCSRPVSRILVILGLSDDLSVPDVREPESRI